MTTLQLDRVLADICTALRNLPSEDSVPEIGAAAAASQPPPEALDLILGEPEAVDQDRRSIRSSAGASSWLGLADPLEAVDAQAGWSGGSRRASASLGSSFNTPPP